MFCCKYQYCLLQKNGDAKIKAILNQALERAEEIKGIKPKEAPNIAANKNPGNLLVSYYLNYFNLALFSFFSIINSS